MQRINKSDLESSYLREHAELLISSFHRCTGDDLVSQKPSGEPICRTLFEAPYCVVSHNTEDDPIFNYGNQAALKLFEMNELEFTNLASRKSAEPLNRMEREQLLTRVKKDGFITDYQGVRISSTGKRFRIEEATVWNVVDLHGVYCGQAAVIYRWSEMSCEDT